MDAAEQDVALRREIGRINDLLGRSSLDAPVAGCPEWTLLDLIRHLGMVHEFWSQIVARRLTDPRQVEGGPQPDDAGVPEWFDETAANLVDVLADAEPGAAVWTWSAQHDVAFVKRRMAQETAVHRWDAEHAVGAPTEVETRLATDGVGEFVEFMVPDNPPLADQITLIASDANRRPAVNAAVEEAALTDD